MIGNNDMMGPGNIALMMMSLLTNEMGEKVVDCEQVDTLCLD